MIAGSAETIMAQGDFAPAASRGSAARLARRLTVLLRDGRSLDVRAPAATCPAQAFDNRAAAIAAAPTMPLAAHGRGVARAPRRPARLGAARRTGGKPGRPGRPDARPAAATRFHPNGSHGQAPSRARPRGPFSNRFRPALPGVTPF